MQVNLLAFVFFRLLLFGFACIDLCRIRMARSLALRPRSAGPRDGARDRSLRTDGRRRHVRGGLTAAEGEGFSSVVRAPNGLARADDGGTNARPHRSCRYVRARQFAPAQRMAGLSARRI